jgi:hypothetical protein
MGAIIYCTARRNSHFFESLVFCSMIQSNDEAVSVARVLLYLMSNYFGSIPMQSFIIILLLVERSVET